MSNLSDIKNAKLFSLEEAVRRRETARMLGKRFVLTNGCFDLLHPGHLYFLQSALAEGDILWVLLNGAESVCALKGPTRPLLGDLERAYSLAALACVSGITFFHTPRLDSEILALQPDIYVKAGDYTLESLDPSERNALGKVGAEVKFLPFLEGFSTTQLVKKIAAIKDL